jgi:hypothetical protein
MSFSSPPPLPFLLINRIATQYASLPIPPSPRSEDDDGGAYASRTSTLSSQDDARLFTVVMDTPPRTISLFIGRPSLQMRIYSLIFSCSPNILTCSRIVLPGFEPSIQYIVRSVRQCGVTRDRCDVSNEAVIRSPFRDNQQACGNRAAEQKRAKA